MMLNNVVVSFHSSSPGRAASFGCWSRNIWARGVPQQPNEAKALILNSVCASAVGRGPCDHQPDVDSNAGPTRETRNKELLVGSTRRRTGGCSGRHAVLS
jgi:hypothetical protein